MEIAEAFTKKQDSNLHARRHPVKSRARLTIPPFSNLVCYPLRITGALTPFLLVARTGFEPVKD